MEDKKRTVNDEFHSLANMILDLSDFVDRYELSKHVSGVLVNILNQVSQLYAFYLDDLDQFSLKMEETVEINIELSKYIEKLASDFEKLYKFVDAAKKFPGFQC